MKTCKQRILSLSAVIGFFAIIAITVTTCGDTGGGGYWLITEQTPYIIGDKAFKDCENLTGVTIPDSVTSIGRYAFDGCTVLTSVTFQGTITDEHNGFDYAFGDERFESYIGDLCEKYLAGGPTYTRTAGGGIHEARDVKLHYAITHNSTVTASPLMNCILRIFRKFAF